MGKYNLDNYDEIRLHIANELAEANRLERYKINHGYYEAKPNSKPLEDEA